MAKGIAAIKYPQYYSKQIWQSLTTITSFPNVFLNFCNIRGNLQAFRLTGLLWWQNCLNFNTIFFMICRFRNSILIWPCSSYRGAVIWSVIGRANGSILECTHVKSSWKNFLNCHTFKDFNFNFSASQIINNRSENFISLFLAIDSILLNYIFNINLLLKVFM